MYSGCPLPALSVGDGVVSALECSEWLPPLSAGRHMQGCVRRLQGARTAPRPWEMFTLNPTLCPTPWVMQTLVGLAVQAHGRGPRFGLTQCQPVPAPHKLGPTMDNVSKALQAVLCFFTCKSTCTTGGKSSVGEVPSPEHTHAHGVVLLAQTQETRVHAQAHLLAAVWH